MQDLLGDILRQAVVSGKIQVSFSGMDRTVAEVVEGECYQALENIKAILDDDTLDDPECFYKIDKIVCVLEEIGSDGGSRHDFG